MGKYESFKDRVFDLTPGWLYRLWFNVLSPKTNYYRVKRFFQRMFWGFDDSETWEMDVTFYKWLQPRLKRFIKVTLTFPGTDEYPTFESWIDELTKRSKQLDRILSDVDYEFDDWSYIPKNELKQLNNRKPYSKEITNMYAKYYCEKDFNEWFGKNVEHLGW